MDMDVLTMTIRNIIKVISIEIGGMVKEYIIIMMEVYMMAKSRMKSHMAMEKSNLKVVNHGMGYLKRMICMEKV